MADTTNNFIVNTTANLSGMQRAVRAMQEAEQQSRRLSRNLSKDAKFIDANTTTSFTKSGREILKTTAIFEQSGQRIAVTTGKVGDSTGLIGESVKSVGSQAKKSTPLLGDFQRALARVAIVVPIWFAFRRSAQLVFTTIRDGVKDIIAFDKALQKARKNLQGSATEIEANFKNLRNEVLRLSIETGSSVEDITNAFQKFATTGLDFETSLAGANASVKTAIVLFGETEEVANAVARAFRILGGRTTEFANKGEELENFLALIAELWKTNAFEINEFASALERFAPTARTANISLQETAILLATIQTAGIRSSRAGRLLSNAVLQMEKNFSKFERTLGINLRTVDSTFERLQLVIKAVDDLNKTDPIRASQAISDLFQVRGGQTIRGLVALNEELIKAQKTVGDFANVEKELEEQNKTISRQAELFRNLNREIGRAFVTGLTGGESFNDALQKITATQKDLIDNFQALGEGFRIAFKAATLQLTGIKKEIERLDQLSLSRVKKEVNELFDLDSIKDPQIIEDLLKNFEEAVPGGIFGFTTDARNEIINELGDRLLELQKITNQKKIKIDLEIEEEIPEIKIPELETDAIQGTLKTIVDNELQILKARGATNSQILRTEQLRNRQLGIVEDELSLLKRELDIEREINEERRLRADLSSDTVKLFRIAKEEGSEVAKRIGEVLSGQVDFNNFVRRGGRELEVFKDQFGDLFEQQQALSFFRGDTVPGEAGLRGGSGIPIREEALRRPISPLGSAGAQATEALRRARQLQVEVSNRIQVSVQVSGLEASEIINTIRRRTIEAISDEINKPGSDIETELNKHLEDF